MTSKREEVEQVIFTVFPNMKLTVVSAISRALLERMPYLQWECVAHWGDTNTSIEFRKEHEWEDVEVDTPQQQTICANCGRAREEGK